MKWKINLPSSPEVVYYLVKLIGLASFSLKNNIFYPPTRLDKLYPVIACAGYICFEITAFYKTIGLITKFAAFATLWHLIIRFIGSMNVIFAPIIFLVMNDKIVYVMNKLCTVGNELKNLGIKEDHGKYFKNLVTTSVIANATLSAVFGALFILDSKWHIATLVQYDIANWFGLNIILMFVQILTCIRQRFTLLNEKMVNLLTPAGNLRTDPRRDRILVTSRNIREDNDRECEDLTDFQRIRMIKTLHLELRDLINRTNQIFAIPIIFNIIHFTLQFMASSYWIYSSFNNLINFDVKSVYASLLRMLTPTVILFILAHTTVITCEQGNFTKVVVFKTWIKFRPPELADEILVFSNQLLHTPITVSAFGFVALDYSLLVKIISGVMTYLIIMIQFKIVFSTT